MTTATIGLFVGLLLAIAAAAGGFTGFLIAIVLGGLGFFVGRYIDGIASFRECLRLDSHNAQALYNLALAYEHLGQFDEALTWVRRALDRDGKDASLQRLELRIRILRLRSRVVRAVRRLCCCRSPTLWSRLGSRPTATSRRTRSGACAARWGPRSRSPSATRPRLRQPRRPSPAGTGAYGVGSTSAVATSPPGRPTAPTTPTSPCGSTSPWSGRRFEWRTRSCRT